MGVLCRNDIGMIVHDRDELHTLELNIGSMVKTPTHPMWLLVTNGKASTR